MKQKNRAVKSSRGTHEPVTQAMLLQCYAALDAFRRGYGSRELVTTLGRYLLVAGELCHLGHQSDAIGRIAAARAAVVRMDATEQQDRVWRIDDADYSRLCVAFAILDDQLSVASLDDIAKAETSIAEGLLGAEREPVVVEPI
ncbi:hypothetical protein SAMN05446935_6558 [Burkholderia sp. YR290]|uniref:hypothetical protein n=1 Tax=Paraburkholderia hospita TaxID=169430 RepID=UPI0009A72E51|nr:hypothetical protein [Paraburkholderia hospita]SKC89467.1 hypothetical protein SAMN05446934_5212 [Paraburkholderia hospita]SOE86064.1 hypothetical protein SAMN05446935_6558 [Burkholderia sp. YR290]